MACSDSSAVVAHEQRQAAVHLRFHPDLDASAAWRGLAAIDEEVHEHLLDEVGIHHPLEVGGDALEFEHALAGRGSDARAREGATHDRLHRHPMHVRLERPGIRHQTPNGPGDAAEQPLHVDQLAAQLLRREPRPAQCLEHTCHSG